MQVQKTPLSDTRIKLTIAADPEMLASTKQTLLQKLKKDVKIAGFRSGKVPLDMVEKNLDQTALQNEFLDNALNQLYSKALMDEHLRPVAQPEVSITKFVPFTTLEFDATVDVIGQVVMPDYKTIKLAKKPVVITDADVQEVLDNLKLRAAEKKEVDRPSKVTDEIWIDFAGRDAMTQEPIKGGDGQDYPLVLGSDTFIPGFEKNLVGAKAGEKREFTIDFPADYGVSALQGRKVTFDVTVKKVQEVTLPAEDDAFAAQVGPFKSLEELKTNIKQQVTADRTTQADRDYESDLLSKITEQSQVAVPETLIDEELTRLEQEERQNVVYRGQTWDEHLAAEGVTDAEHRAKNRPGAELRVRAGLVLAEIAEQEHIEISPEEFEMRLKLLKGQYQDAAMQAELDKMENRRELASRMLSEKTIAKLVSYAVANKPDTPKKAKAN